MATFNWSYKNGYNNKYGLVVPATANESTRPANWAYVAPWGNDTTGNGSRQLPYRTIAKSMTGNLFVILAPGVYREVNNGAGVTLIGDGNVIIDGTLLRSNFASGNLTAAYNITFRGFSTINTNSATAAYDCIFYNLSGFNTNVTGNASPMTGNLFVNCEIGINSQSTITAVGYNTFYKCSVLFLTATSVQAINAMIFSECNVSFATTPQYIDFCLFWHCNFRFNATKLSGGTTFYPSVPTGYSYISDITTLRAANVTAFGATNFNFINCVFGDPLFNNPAINDFTLQFTSPAKNKSYFGDFIGAFSIANKLSVKASSVLSNFDNSSAVNLTIADDSLTLTSTSSPASIETKPIANLLGRQISKFNALYINADRNGEFISSVLNLSASPLSPGTVPINTPFLVQNGSITYNSQVYLAGERFTSASTSLSFTTTTGGVIAEILQAPSRQVVEARFNDGAASTVDNTATLVEGTWYYVVSGTATYNGDNYTADSFLKVVAGVTSFTGTGILRPIFAVGDTYYLFELGIAPTTNNTGNVVTGSIVRGNGHESFDRTPANIFSVNKKFIQLKYTIQTNNLNS